LGGGGWTSDSLGDLGQGRGSCRGWAAGVAGGARAVEAAGATAIGWRRRVAADPSRAGARRRSSPARGQGIGLCGGKAPASPATSQTSRAPRAAWRQDQLQAEVRSPLQKEAAETEADHGARTLSGGVDSSAAEPSAGSVPTPSSRTHACSPTSTVASPTAATHPFSRRRLGGVRGALNGGTGYPHPLPARISPL
jgi:hypothetical protein